VLYARSPLRLSPHAFWQAALRLRPAQCPPIYRYNGAFDSSRPSILKKALGLAHIANSAMHHEFAPR
jgi:hypothetical protein